MLAALHFNENAGREQATTQDGDLQYTVGRPRCRNGEAVAKIKKVKCTRGILS